MHKLWMVCPLILTSACAVLPNRPAPIVLPPTPEPIAVIAPAECTTPGEDAPAFNPMPLPPRAPETADAIAKLKAELARAVNYGEQITGAFDRQRVWSANRADRDRRCSEWAAGINK